MQLPALLSITPIYIAILGLLFLPLTLRVALYRIKNRINIGTGDDPEILRRIRGQANFIETVPMALFLLLVMEILGAADIWLHALGLTLVVGRIFHYLGLTKLGPFMLRPIGMVATLATILIGSVWILFNIL